MNTRGKIVFTGVPRRPGIGRPRRLPDAGRRARQQEANAGERRTPESQDRYRLEEPAPWSTAINEGLSWPLTSALNRNLNVP